MTTDIISVGEQRLVHVFQHIGGREVQNDRFLVVPISDIKKEDLERIFAAVHEELLERFSEDQLQIAGTTATFVFTRAGKQIITANLGDSRTNLIIQDTQALALHIHPLTEDDKPKKKGETERILAAGGIIKSGRIYAGNDDAERRKRGTLNSAAFGDLYHGDRLRRTPDIRSFDLADLIKERQVAFLEPESDGMRFRMKESERALRLSRSFARKTALTAERLLSGIQNLPGIKHRELTRQLKARLNSEDLDVFLAAHDELESLRPDNMTCAVSRIDEADTPGHAILICDGHGEFEGDEAFGGEVAQAVIDLFEAHLEPFAP